MENKNLDRERVALFFAQPITDEVMFESKDPFLTSQECETRFCLISPSPALKKLPMTLESKIGT